MEAEYIQPRRNKAGEKLFLKKALAIVVVILVLGFAAALVRAPNPSSKHQSSAISTTPIGERKTLTTNSAAVGIADDVVNADGTTIGTTVGTTEPLSQQGKVTAPSAKLALTTPQSRGAEKHHQTTVFKQVKKQEYEEQVPPKLSTTPFGQSRNDTVPSSAKAATFGAGGSGGFLPSKTPTAMAGVGAPSVGAHLTAYLYNPSNQIAIAAGASVVGTLFGLVGCRIWNQLFVASLAAVVSGATCYAASACGLVPNLFLVIGLMLHVAVAVGWAVHVGFDGFQTLFGAILGLAFAYGSGNWARNLAPGASLLWYQAGAIFGMAVYKAYQKPVVVMLAPILGGLLVSSGLGSLGRLLLYLTWLPPRDASWLHAVNTLLGGAGISSLGLHLGSALIGGLLVGYSGLRWIAVVYPIVSIGAGSLVTSVGASCTTDSGGTLECTRLAEWRWTLVGCIAWVVLAVASVCFQIGQLARRDLQGGLEAHIPADSHGQGPRQASSGSLSMLPSPGKAEVLRYTPSPTLSKNAEVQYSLATREPSSPKANTSSFSLMKDPLSPKNAEPRHGPASAAHSARTGPTSRPPTSRRTPGDAESYEPSAGKSRFKQVS